MNGEKYTCPYTNEKLNYIGSQVHHKEPKTFKQLIADFIKENMIDIKSVQINSATDDGLIQDTLKDKKLEQSWIDFHNLHADLQIVSKKANLSFSKK